MSSQSKPASVVKCDLDVCGAARRESEPKGVQIVRQPHGFQWVHNNGEIAKLHQSRVVGRCAVLPSHVPDERDFRECYVVLVDAVGERDIRECCVELCDSVEERDLQMWDRAVTCGKLFFGGRLNLAQYNSYRVPVRRRSVRAERKGKM